jgi:stearoyl-CoA desaturase (Delta-9 desaturase)
VFLGRCAGYHRLFAHQCYKAHWALRWYLMLMASGAVQGSLRWWSRDHRAHHKYVDTDKDPYAAPKGFWYSHIGWMLVKQDPKRIGKVDISDLEEDWMIKTQHKFYPVFGLGMGYVFPALVAWLLWNDPWGGFFFGGCLRLVFVHHSTFCVNSLAHYAGEQGYSDGHTAKDSILTALVTFGEGYHNFHHEFPNDYRNGYEWWQWDPTKWFINAMAALGLAYDLVRFPRSEIEKGKVQMDHKRVYERATRFDWGPDPAALPLMTAADVKRLCAKEGRSLVTLNGFVLDLKPFVDQHPGGPGYIRSNLGEDITDMFCGETYRHSNAAANLAATFRIARLQKAS